MELRDLLKQVDDEAQKARMGFAIGNDDEAYKHLVILRELLNKQPELEAGGQCESVETRGPAGDSEL